MKKLLTFITGASLKQIKSRMAQVNHESAMYRNIIARRTIKVGPRVQSTVTPNEWVEFPNCAQVNEWYKYVTNVRVAK